MTIRWSPTTARDLESLHSYVAEGNHDAAAATVERILSGIDALRRHPQMGRVGRLPRTRELITPPYVVAYRVSGTVIELLAIIHSARRWPGSL
jgi:toxin ParE1/3/4